MSKRIHEMKGPEANQWAKIEEDDFFSIIDGWNCGQITAAIPFPNLATARTFLAGRWNVHSGTIALVATRENKPELTTDEKILKMVHNWQQGLCTEDELLWQLTILRHGVLSENEPIQ